jgi:hypothetical protein
MDKSYDREILQAGTRLDGTGSNFGRDHLGNKILGHGTTI